jgi:diguanylate cyclase (GGDEF)-like protein
MLSLAIFDIDHFKEVNDTRGHIFGDYVLKTIADIARENIREIDYLVRWGGEEFMIILPETGLEKAEAISERIKKKIENHNFDKIGKVTVSFGVTQFKNEDSGETFILRADDALYKAKQNGRNRVEVGI